MTRSHPCKLAAPCTQAAVFENFGRQDQLFTRLANARMPAAASAPIKTGWCCRRMSDIKHTRPDHPCGLMVQVTIRLSNTLQIGSAHMYIYVPGLPDWVANHFEMGQVQLSGKPT